MVKNPPANAGDTRDADSVPGLGRSRGGGHGNHASTLAWRIPWKEETGRLQSIGLQSWTRLKFSSLAHSSAKQRTHSKIGRANSPRNQLIYKKSKLKIFSF